MVNVGCMYMGSICGSGIVSREGDVFEMSGMRGIDGMCERCLCLAGW